MVSVCHYVRVVSSPGAVEKHFPRITAVCLSLPPQRFIHLCGFLQELFKLSQTKEIFVYTYMCRQYSSPVDMSVFVSVNRVDVITYRNVKVDVDQRRSRMKIKHIEPVTQ